MLEYAYQVARLSRLRERYANTSGVRRAQVAHRIHAVERTLERMEAEGIE